MTCESKKIVLPKYVQNYTLCPFKTEEEAREYGLTFEHNRGQNNYVIYWGTPSYQPEYGYQYGVMESGFFNNALFIDTIGNYQSSSLNTKLAYDMVSDFDLNGKKSAKEIIFNQPLHEQSKFHSKNDSNAPRTWDNIILALQNPGDRSILAVSRREDYYKFVDDCCNYYRDNLFLKMHPWNTAKDYEIFANMAKKYGCSYGHASNNIIDNCEFVISYNSTFAIDCLLRDIPYVQYNIGTFYSAYGVIYSNKIFPFKIEKKEDGQKLCNFLIYKYCYRRDMDKDKLSKMLNHYSISKHMFPMIDEFSYGCNTDARKI